MNSLQWNRREVIEVTERYLDKSNKNLQQSKSGGDYALIETPSMGYAALEPVNPKNPASVGKLLLILFFEQIFSIS